MAAFLYKSNGFECCNINKCSWEKLFLAKFFELVSPGNACGARRVSAMERVMGGGVLPLMLASAGILLLYRILVRLRPGAALQDAVVVITGASSGLGKGRLLVHFLFYSAYM